MNWIQEQALRIVYYDKYSCDEGFMEKDSSFSVQRRKIRVLVFEPCKHEHNISLSLIQKTFSYRAQKPIKEDTIFSKQKIYYSEI